MSGTSAEGVDAAYLHTDGERIDAFGPTAYEPLQDNERRVIRAAMAEAVSNDAARSTPTSDAAGRAITQAHLRLVAKLPSDAPDVAIAGFHGQTLFHRPPPAPDPVTWQVGDAAEIAQALNAPVVMDLRQADLAAGGQGAPLVPVFHKALIDRLSLTTPVAVLNIGGVANVTYVDETTIVAFDCGPGNAPLDEWAERRLGLPYDKDGANAARGTVDRAAVKAFLSHRYFSEPPPKSLDRYGVLPELGQNLSKKDEAATLTACIASGIAMSLNVLGTPPRRWLVCGGGARNPVLMQALREALGVPVEPVEIYGLAGDFIEAQAFAYLAVRSHRGLPITLPSTTGVAQPLTGGRTVYPEIR